jgi:dUTP pyrophosphatase
VSISKQKKAAPEVEPDRSSKAPAVDNAVQTALYVSRMRPTDDDETFTPPSRQHLDDVGLDLTCSRYLAIQPSTRALIPHNLKVQFPAGHFGLILPRSSALHLKGLIVQTGTIDPGYRGELRTVIYNPTGKAIHIEPGESLSHLVVLPFVAVPVLEVEVLDENTERGSGAFGSTGRVRPWGANRKDHEDADAK